MDYETLAAQYRILTEGCGLIDRSKRGKLALSGDEAVEFLQALVSQDVSRLSEGDGCYSAVLTPKGKMLGDLRVSHFGDELFLDCERAALQDIFNILHRSKVGRNVALGKRTLECGIISLIGPQVDAVIGDFVPAPAAYSNAKGVIDGLSVHAIRAEEGIDVLCAADELEAVARGLIDRGAQAVSEDAGEIIRVEHGRPRYGIDLDETVIPQEAGLNDRAVSFEKGCYVGQETVARLYYKGKPNRQLRGLRFTVPVGRGAALFLDEKQVGIVSSSVVSPRFGPIGLAIVRRQASVGARLTVAGHQENAAEVSELPFANLESAVR